MTEQEKAKRAAEAAAENKKLLETLRDVVNMAAKEGVNPHDFVCHLNFAFAGVAEMASLNGALARGDRELESAWAYVAILAIKGANIAAELHKKVCPHADSHDLPRPTAPGSATPQ